jgi:uroporphyrinogen decarboxylase
LIDHFEKTESTRDTPVGLYLGSLFGQIRNWMGIEAVTYLQVDDEELFDEIVSAVFELCYKAAEEMLNSKIVFDFAHIWEDICFKNGPLISPAVYQTKFGPLYKRFVELLGRYDIDIVSLDCDGLIDSLIPIWLDNGVNTMFPIEVGTWGASIAQWREKYGKRLLGVGGMDKRVFAHDFAAVDREVERLKPLIDMGGYIPCPDHLLAPDAKWDNVRYYCERMRKEFC